MSGEEESDHEGDDVGGNLRGKIIRIKPNQLRYVRHIASTLMTRVDLCEWKMRDLPTLVVKKRLYRGSIPNRQAIDLKRELSILSKVNHPNVVRVFGVVPDQDDFGLVMEFCRFGSYKSFFTDIWNRCAKTKHLEGALAPLKIQNISEVVEAMAYLHSLKPKRILHMDLKGDNILLDKNITVKVGDFGLSRMKTLTILRSTATSLDPLGGTPGYIAPERLRNCKSQATTKDDVFAFGILMWEMLTDSQPFEDQDATNILLLEQYIAFNDLRPDISKVPDVYQESFKEIIQTMNRSWAPMPDERPSFEELRESIDIIKQKVVQFEEKVNRAKQTTYLLCDLRSPTDGSGNRVTSPSVPERRPICNLDDKTTTSLPLFNRITVPKCHSYTRPNEEVFNENSPLVPNLVVHKPCMSITKGLVLLSILLSLAIATSLLIWRNVDSKGCDTLPKPRNGSVNCTEMSSTVSKKCQFSCAVGFQLVGRSEITCTSGKWNAKPPVCGRVCPAYPPDPNGVTTCSNGVFENSTCTATCLHNHEIRGNASIRCGKNGTWTGPFPKCLCPNCKVGASCQFSIRWADVATAVQDVEAYQVVTVPYGEHSFTCEPGIYAFTQYHSRCRDQTEDFNCEGYDSASGATYHAAAVLIRFFAEKGMYQEPCDAERMPPNC